jgi:hypothetical protein
MYFGLNPLFTLRINWRTKFRIIAGNLNTYENAPNSKFMSKQFIVFICLQI